MDDVSNLDGVSLRSRGYLRAVRDVSVTKETCYACGHVRTIYRRRFPKSDLPALLALFRASQQGAVWVHVTRLRKRTVGGDFAKFRYWGLTEERPNEGPHNPHKKTSGYWRITERGSEFMLGRHSVHTHVFLGPKSEFIRLDGERVNLKEASQMFGFSYLELMRGD